MENENGEKIFQGCLAVHIGGREPIKADEYWFDGDVISAKSDDKLRDGTPVKVLFTTSSSFKYDRSFHAQWDRMYVYVDNKSDYFNRFELVDEISDNQVSDIRDVYKKGESEDDTILMVDEFGAISSHSSLPKNLKSTQRSGVAQFFPQATLYQAIEAKFPKVADKIAVWGIYKMDTIESTYKTLFDRDVEITAREELFKLIDIKNYLKKVHDGVKDENIKMMTSLIEQGDMDATISKKIETIKKSKGKVVSKKDSSYVLGDVNKGMLILIVLGVFLVILVGGLFFFKRKK